MTNRSTDYVEDFDYEDIKLTLETWRLRHQDIDGVQHKELLQRLLNRIRKRECYVTFSVKDLATIARSKHMMQEQGML